MLSQLAPGLVVVATMVAAWAASFSLWVTAQAAGGPGDLVGWTAGITGAGFASLAFVMVLRLIREARKAQHETQMLIDELQEERHHWRDRAMSAEHRLADLQHPDKRKGG